MFIAAWTYVHWHMNRCSFCRVAFDACWAKISLVHQRIVNLFNIFYLVDFIPLFFRSFAHPFLKAHVWEWGWDDIIRRRLLTLVFGGFEPEVGSKNWLFWFFGWDGEPSLAASPVLLFTAKVMWGACFGCKPLFWSIFSGILHEVTSLSVVLVDYSVIWFRRKLGRKTKRTFYARLWSSLNIQSVSYIPPIKISQTDQKTYCFGWLLI